MISGDQELFFGDTVDWPAFSNKTYHISINISRFVRDLAVCVEVPWKGETIHHTSVKLFKASWIDYEVGAGVCVRVFVTVETRVAEATMGPVTPDGFIAALDCSYPTIVRGDRLSPTETMLPCDSKTAAIIRFSFRVVDAVRVSKTAATIPVVTCFLTDAVSASVTASATVNVTSLKIWLALCVDPSAVGTGTDSKMAASIHVNFCATDATTNDAKSAGTVRVNYISTTNPAVSFGVAPVPV
jgi:hypothetical protein